MNRFEEVQALLDAVKDDFKKFYDDGNKAAGTRVRKSMMELKKVADAIRKEVTEIKNADK